MVASNFETSLKLVLQSEGGNDDDPADHGGRTSRGITQREYDAWRRERGAPPADVWEASQQDIETIYHDEYWAPNCDKLPIGADYLLFNMNVNAGTVQGAKILQRALGVVPDGRIGPVTRDAASKAAPIGLIIRYSDECRAFYRSLHQPKFLKGWLNRVDAVQHAALQMVQHLAIS